MNKKGFTLVELLAVIIILTLLALLTSTAVTKLVKDSKEKLSNAQLRLIESAAEAWGADNLAKLPETGSCGYLTLQDLKEYGFIDSNILDPNNSQLISDDLKIKITTTTSSYGNSITNYEVNPKSVEGCYRQLYKDGDIVYFDVTKGESCTNYNVENSKTGYNGFNGTGNQNGCLKFYAFLDNGSKVNLLLDHNILEYIQWTDNDDNCNGGPKAEFLQSLKNGTDKWLGTEPLHNYVNSREEANYVIRYNNDNYKARLITLEEVIQITNNKNYNDASDTYYFDTNTDKSSSTCTIGNTTGCKYGWLYDRTSVSCKANGCLNNSDEKGRGYWTATAEGNLAHYITLEARIYADVANGDMGLRPVIEVSKVNLQ